MGIQADVDSPKIVPNEVTTSVDSQTSRDEGQHQPTSWSSTSANIGNGINSVTKTEQPSTTTSCNSSNQAEPDREPQNQQSRGTGEMYSTHKCLLIHDPWLRNFQREKFSKWFDIERLEVNSLFDLMRSGTLLDTVSKFNPRSCIHSSWPGRYMEKA